MKDKFFFVAFQEDGVYINSTMLINKKRTQQFKTFQLILLTQMKAIIDHSKNDGITWYELAAELERQTKKSITESHVRQLIYLIKKSIRNNLKKHPEDIIELTNNHYRFTEKVVLSLSSKIRN